MGKGEKQEVGWQDMTAKEQLNPTSFLSLCLSSSDTDLKVNWTHLMQLEESINQSIFTCQI